MRQNPHDVMKIVPVCLPVPHDPPFITSNEDTCPVRFPTRSTHGIDVNMTRHSPMAAEGAMSIYQGEN